MSLALDPACPCEDCSAVRADLTTLARSKKLPDALVHDDGQPVMVEAGDSTITVAEARLRLALADPRENGDEIRRAIARLREYHPGDSLFADRHGEAAKLLAKLDARVAR